MSQSVAAAIPSSPSTTSSQPASLPGSVAIPPNNVPQEPTKCNNPQQPPITFKAIKLKYDTGCDENKKELKKEVHYYIFTAANKTASYDHIREDN